jgi:hypothetical protein
MSLERRNVVTATLAGTAWVTVKTFELRGKLSEIWAKVPALAGVSTVTLGLFDHAQLTDGDERWNSGTKAESTTHALIFNPPKPVSRGDLLKIKKSEAGTEDVEVIIFWERN